VSYGFNKVSPKRPCRICHKPDWCGYSRDERTSICMRVSDGRKGPARNGGHVHVHNDLPVSFDRQTAPRKPATQPIKVAPIEVRDAVYRDLIRLSPAIRYSRQLIDHPTGLRARGLLQQETVGYGALPPTQKERALLARSLCAFARRHFPAYANLVGIPGCWQDRDGFTQIWKPRDYRMPMLLIPYKDSHGRIQACQLRLHPSDIPEGQKRYRWLASPNEPRGCSSGTPIHFTFKADTIPAGAKIVITEGALKADTLVSLRKVPVIATSGVSCSHDELIEAARPYHVLIGFDTDHKTNPAVCRQLARLIAAREADTSSRGLSTKILSWDNEKGIDEAAHSNRTICALSIPQWLRTLSGPPLQEVLKMWREVKFALSK
jgi:hypothetical protein